MPRATRFSPEARERAVRMVAALDRSRHTDLLPVAYPTGLYNVGPGAAVRLLPDFFHAA